MHAGAAREVDTACLSDGATALGYAVEHFRISVERADRSMAGLALGDSLLGAIAPDRDVAHRTRRIAAAFYIPSMPTATLLERHGTDHDAVTSVTQGDAAGQVQRAPDATLHEVADRIKMAGTPGDWISWLGLSCVRGAGNTLKVDSQRP